MESGKRRREPAQVCVKRVKDALGLPLLQPAEALPESQDCEAKKEPPQDLAPAFQRSHHLCEEASSRLRGFAPDQSTAPTLPLVLQDLPPFPPLFDSGCREQYAQAREARDTLLRQAQNLEARLRLLEAASADFQSQAHAQLENKKRLFEEQMAGVQTRFQQVEAKVKHLDSMRELYQRISALEVVQTQPQKFRCKLRVQQNEMIFRVNDEVEGLELDTLSYTVSAQRVPEHLKGRLLLSPNQEPLLLWQLFSCLL